MPPQSAEVLVVDDSDVNCVLLKRRLQAEGYGVTVAHDGAEALQKIEEQTFDLVLLDVMMPGLSGIEVLEIVRQNSGVGDLPIIMATANDESSDIVDAFSRGANDYVTKPFDFSVVMARVRTQLALRRAMEENRRLVQEVERRNQFIRRIFGRYVDNEIVEQLLEKKEGLSIGGESRRITVLMADLRGFTPVAERLAPQDVLTVINNYLTVMTDVIMDCGGTIDEFIGDAILVLFGAPVDREDHARAAVRCALRMQLAMGEVNRRNAARKLPSVEMGVGINTGEVVVGNIGSERRTKYGVVGHHVNLASRIESYTVGGQILIADSTFRDAGADVLSDETIEVQPKGSPAPVAIHRVRGLAGENLFIEEEQSEIVELPSPLSVELSVVAGKDAGGPVCTVEVVALSRREARLRGACPQLLTNLKLQIRGDASAQVQPIYAKVTSMESSNSFFRVRFTSVPEDAAQVIGELLGAQRLVEPR